ncbi:phosphatidylserine decarboxylase [Nonomuraea dietziae]|uniref:phosphatidylserine decarboxylase n=1 Tax=Nonomuraea dietziae TaxID=65515 RepID=UPI0031D42596
MLWFFRDPDRVPGEGRILSPADGVVQSIDSWPDGRTRVAIFMSPLNVHVNRAPLCGNRHLRAACGGWVPAGFQQGQRPERARGVAFRDRALGDIEMVQIAGAVARRIVPYVNVGDKLSQTERIGLIRFGSRVDIYLPEGISPAVTVGDKTVAGVTPIDRG